MNSKLKIKNGSKKDSKSEFSGNLIPKLKMEEELKLETESDIESTEMIRKTIKVFPRTQTAFSS